MDASKDLQNGVLYAALSVIERARAGPMACGPWLIASSLHGPPAQSHGG